MTTWPSVVATSVGCATVGIVLVTETDTVGTA